MIIRSNTFTSSGGTLLSPYNTVHKFAAIVLDDVERVVIGDYSLNASVSPNEFSNSRYGIIARKSNTEVFNNKFSVLTGYAEPWPITIPGLTAELKDNSVAIYSGSDFDFNDRRLWVGESEGPNSNHTRNYFENVKFGIWARDEQNVEIYHNDFGFGDIDGANGTNGVKIMRPGDKNIRVNDGNNFNSFLFGVRISEPTSGSNIVIDENTFYSGLRQSNGFTGTGINISHAIATKPAVVSITRNVMGGTLDGNFRFPRIGIRLANIEGAGIDGNEIFSNFSSTPGDYYTGIWLQGADGTKLTGNTIANVASPTTLQSFADLLVGLRMQYSKNTCIKQNSISKMGQSMRFKDNCYIFSYLENTMDEFENGIYLDFAEIGRQIGGPIYGGNYNDVLNQWIQTSGASQDRIVGDLIYPGQIVWWHSAGSNFSSPLYPGGSSSLIQANNIPSNEPILSIDLCPEEENNEPPLTMNERNSSFGSIAADTARYPDDFYSAFKYSSEISLFDLLKRYPSILDYNDSSDISFQDFYESRITSNIGKIHEVLSLIKVGSFNEADDIASGIIDTNVIETNFKTVMSSYKDYRSMVDSLPPVDSLLLDSIAHLSTYEFGFPVLLAQNLLDLEIYDAPAGESRMAQPERFNPAIGSLLIIPNPATQIVRLIIPENENIQEVQLIDATGRAIKEMNNNHTFNISKLPNGMYLVQVKTNIKLRQGKLVVLR